MGSEELLAALRREGEKKAESIRAEAEASAARIRDEAAGRLEAIRRRFARDEVLAAEAEERAIVAEAERAARKMILAGTERLAQRLYEAALAQLSSLRAIQGEDLLARLAAELPPCDWERLRVHPADQAQTQALFPKACVESDQAVGGGLEAWSRGGELHVVNTLEKRLERAWPELLPLLLKEVENCVRAC